MMAAVTVLVVGDARWTTEGRASTLGASPGITVVGRANTGRDAQRLIGALGPRVVMIDEHLPDGDGTVLAERIRDRRPEIATVLITSSDDETLTARAAEAGCAACLSACHDDAELIDVVHAAARGDVTFPAWALVGGIGRRRDPDETARKLTPREYAVLDLLVGGRSTTQIAEMLAIKPATVRGHVRNVRIKLRARSDAEAIRTAVRYGVFR